MKNIFLFSILITIISACETKPKNFKSLEEQIVYIDNAKNGLLKKKECDYNIVELSYKPIEQLILQELGDKIYNSALVDSLKKIYNENCYFLVKIRPQKGKTLYTPIETPQQYNDIIQTFSFHFVDYTKAIVGNEEIKPKAVFFDQLFGMSNELNCMIVFKRTDLTSNKLFTIVISEFGLKTGKCSFEFTNKDISECPILLLSNTVKK